MLWLSPFVVSLFGALAFTPLSKLLARRLGAIDAPGELKVHATATPRFGGSAIWAATVIAALLGILLLQNKSDAVGLLIVLAGATLMALLGAVDDIRGLQPRIRFGLGLMISATTAALALFTAGHTGPAALLGVVLLTLWLAGSSNAMNMLDGLDGLAAGVTAIAAAAIGTIALLAHNHTCAVLGFSLAGACAGFLRYNFRPASTFMGDVGSLFLGFTLASSVLLLLRGVGESRSVASAVVAAMLAMGVPIGDMVLAMVRRFLNHKPLFQGDRSHSYDQLRDRFGFSVVNTVLVCYVAGLLLGAVAVGISLQSPWFAVAATLIVIIALAVVLIKGAFLRREV